MDAILLLFIVIIVIALLVSGWAIATTNRFKALDIRTQEGLSGIEVALEKRYDMLTKMLDVAKAYMKHETDLFTKTVELRRGMTPDELAAADAKIDNISARFFAVAEGYPEMRSSQVFIELENGIQDAEAHLQAARRVYNVNVTEYNTAIVMFPNSLLAGSRTAKQFFEASENKKEDVKMDFGN